MRFGFAILLILITPRVLAQDINVEYDKKRDFSRYRTFAFGESEVITPKDRRQTDEALLTKWVKGSIGNQLKEKGLQPVDSVADLVVSFVIGSQERRDVSQLGHLGTSRPNSSQTWSRDYQMGNLIIDLNDRNNNLIWRITATTTSSASDIEQLIDQVVSAGFKKFSLKPKKVKKKK